MARRTKGFVSILLVVTFAITNVIGPAPALAREINLPPAPSLDRLTVPADLGTVEALERSKSFQDAPFLFHLQTAHGNYEAQKKIAALLGFLTRRYGIDLLLLEGAGVKLHPEIDRYFKNSEWNRQILESRTRRGLATGAGLFLLDNLQDSKAKRVQAVGIESLRAYRKNRLAFQRVLREREKQNRLIEKFNDGMQKNFESGFSRPLREFLRRREAFEKHELAFDAWFRELQKNARLTLGLNLHSASSQQEWPALVRLARLRKIEKRLDRAAIRKDSDRFLKDVRRFLPEELLSDFQVFLSLRGETSDKAEAISEPSRVGARKDGSPLEETSYSYGEIRFLLERVVDRLPIHFLFDRYPYLKIWLQWLVFRNEIKPDVLTDELDRLSRSISFRLAKTREEKRRLKEFFDYQLLRRLFELEITAKDYPHLKRLRRLRLPQPLAALYEKTVEFYEGAKERERGMAENAEREIRAHGARVAVLITGGFHADSLRETFREKGFSYALVTPKIGESASQEGSGIESRANYFDSFLRSPAPAYGFSQIENAAALPIPDSLLPSHGVNQSEIRGIRTSRLAARKRFPESPTSLTRSETRAGASRLAEVLRGVRKEHHDKSEELAVAREETKQALRRGLPHIFIGLLLGVVIDWSVSARGGSPPVAQFGFLAGFIFGAVMWGLTVRAPLRKERGIEEEVTGLFGRRRSLRSEIIKRLGIAFPGDGVSHLSDKTNLNQALDVIRPWLRDFEIRREGLFKKAEEFRQSLESFRFPRSPEESASFEEAIDKVYERLEDFYLAAAELLESDGMGEKIAGEITAQRIPAIHRAVDGFILLVQEHRQKHGGFPFLRSEVRTKRSDGGEGKWEIFDRFVQGLNNLPYETIKAADETDGLGEKRRILVAAGIQEANDVDNAYLVSAIAKAEEKKRPDSKEKDKTVRWTELLSFGGVGRYLIAYKDENPGDGWVVKIPNSEERLRHIDLYALEGARIAMKRLGSGLVASLRVIDSRKAGKRFVFNVMQRGRTEAPVAIVQEKILPLVEYLKQIGRKGASEEETQRAFGYVDKFKALVIQMYRRGVVDTDRFNIVGNYGIRKSTDEITLFDVGDLSEDPREARGFVEALDSFNELVTESLLEIDDTELDPRISKHFMRRPFQKEDFIPEGKDLFGSEYDPEKSRGSFPHTEQEVRGLFSARTLSESERQKKPVPGRRSEVRHIAADRQLLKFPFRVRIDPTKSAPRRWINGEKVFEKFRDLRSELRAETEKAIEHLMAALRGDVAARQLLAAMIEKGVTYEQDRDDENLAKLVAVIGVALTDEKGSEALRHLVRLAQQKIQFPKKAVLAWTLANAVLALRGDQEANKKARQVVIEFSESGGYPGAIANAVLAIRGDISAKKKLMKLTKMEVIGRTGAAKEARVIQGIAYAALAYIESPNAKRHRARDHLAQVVQGKVNYPLPTNIVRILANGILVLSPPTAQTPRSEARIPASTTGAREKGKKGIIQPLVMTRDDHRRNILKAHGYSGPRLKVDVSEPFENHSKGRLVALWNFPVTTADHDFPDSSLSLYWLHSEQIQLIPISIEGRDQDSVPVGRSPRGDRAWYRIYPTQDGLRWVTMDEYNNVMLFKIDLSSESPRAVRIPLSKGPSSKGPSTQARYSSEEEWYRVEKIDGKEILVVELNTSREDEPSEIRFNLFDGSLLALSATPLGGRSEVRGKDKPLEALSKKFEKLLSDGGGPKEIHRVLTQIEQMTRNLKADRAARQGVSDQLFPLFQEIKVRAPGDGSKSVILALTILGNLEIKDSTKVQWVRSYLASKKAYEVIAAIRSLKKMGSWEVLDEILLTLGRSHVEIVRAAVAWLVEFYSKSAIRKDEKGKSEVVAQLQTLKNKPKVVSRLAREIDRAIGIFKGERSIKARQKGLAPIAQAQWGEFRRPVVIIGPSVAHSYEALFSSMRNAAIRQGTKDREATRKHLDVVQAKLLKGLEANSFLWDEEKKKALSLLVTFFATDAEHIEVFRHTGRVITNIVQTLKETLSSENLLSQPAGKISSALWVIQALTEAAINLRGAYQGIEGIRAYDNERGERKDWFRKAREEINQTYRQLLVRSEGFDAGEAAALAGLRHEMKKGLTDPVTDSSTLLHRAEVRGRGEIEEKIETVKKEISGLERKLLETSSKEPGKRQFLQGLIADAQFRLARLERDLQLFNLEETRNRIRGVLESMQASNRTQTLATGLAGGVKMPVSTPMKPIDRFSPLEDNGAAGRRAETRSPVPLTKSSEGKEAILKLQGVKRVKDLGIKALFELAVRGEKKRADQFEKEILSDRTLKKMERLEKNKTGTRPNLRQAKVGQFRQALAYGFKTTYGSKIYFSNKTSRSAKRTEHLQIESEDFKADWGQEVADPEFAKRVLEAVQQSLKQKELIQVDRSLGQDPESSRHFRLLVSKDYGRLAHELTALHFKAGAGASSKVPDILTIDLPDFDLSRYGLAKQKQPYILRIPSRGITLVLGTDYFGEIKKSALTMNAYLAKSRGNLALHAGSKEVKVRDSKTGKIKTLRILATGLSGTGKTSTLIGTQGFGEKDSEESSVMRQDDFVELQFTRRRKMGAIVRVKVKGLERGIYYKTAGLHPKKEPKLFNAAGFKGTILSNVWMNETHEGLVPDYGNTTITKNGRGVVPREWITKDPSVDMNGIDVMILLTRRRTIIPAVARLSPAQAAAYWVLGESELTSAADPTQEGQSAREPGFSSFIAGSVAEEANLLYELFRTHPKIQVVLANTGSVGAKGTFKGEKITISDSAALFRALFRGNLTFGKSDPDWGYGLPTKVPGLNIAKFDPHPYYSPAEYRRMTQVLRKERTQWLKNFPGLHPDILAAIPRSEARNGVSSELDAEFHKGAGHLLGDRQLRISAPRSEVRTEAVKVLVAEEPASDETVESIRKIVESFGAGAVFIQAEPNVGKNKEALGALIQEVRPAVVLIRSGTVAFQDPEFVKMARAHGVRAIIRMGMGTEKVDSASTKEAGISVIRTLGSENSVANLTLRFLLAALGGPEDPQDQIDLTEAEGWNEIFDIPIKEFLEALVKSEENGRGTLTEATRLKLFKTMSGEKARQILERGLEGKTIGLIGFGSIAKEVARKLKMIRELTGIQFTVMATSPSLTRGDQKKLREAAKLGVKVVTDDEVLAKSDIISLHLPAPGRGEPPYFTEERLSKAARLKVLIDTSRQKLIKPAALRKFLKAPDAVYFADVDLAKEGKVIPTLAKFIRHPKASMVPHIGAFTPNAAEGVEANTLLTLRATIELLLDLLPSDPSFKLDIVNGVVPNPIRSKPRAEVRQGKSYELRVSSYELAGAPKNLRLKTLNSKPSQRAEAREGARLPRLGDRAKWERIENRLRWFAAKEVALANEVKHHIKGGGHQSASASSLHLMMAIYLVAKRAWDHVADKPHASPVFHSLLYLLGLVDKDPEQARLRMQNLRDMAVPDSQERLQRKIENLPSGYQEMGQGLVSDLEKTLPDETEKEKQRWGEPGWNAYPSIGDPGVTIPTGSMGIGPASAILLALGHKWLQAHGHEVPDSHFFAVVGDAELDEGGLVEVLPEAGEYKLGNVIHLVDYNRQSLDGNRKARDREFIIKTYKNAGWRVIELGRWGQKMRKAFRTAPEGLLERAMDRITEAEYQVWLSMEGADVREKIVQKLIREDEKAKLRKFLEINFSDEKKFFEFFTALGGHDFYELARILEDVRSTKDKDQPVMILAHTVKGWGLPSLMGDPLNHSHLEEELEKLRKELGVEGEDSFPLFEKGSLEETLIAQIRERIEEEQKEYNALIQRNQEKSDAALAHKEFQPELLLVREQKKARRISTQVHLGWIVSELASLAKKAKASINGTLAALWDYGRRTLPISPDVGSSTGLAGAMNLNVFGEPREEWAHELVAALWPKDAKGRSSPDTRPTPHGRFFKLGIKEATAVHLAAALGKMREFYGVTLFPMVFIYDMFYRKAVDQISYAQHWLSRFFAVGTPSGVSLSTDGDKHQSRIEPLIFLATPNVIVWEPAFRDELDFILAESFQRMASGEDEGRQIVYLRGTTLPVDRTELEKRLEGRDRVEWMKEVLAGGYLLVDHRGKTGYDPEENVVNIVAIGTMAQEALAASDALLKQEIYANVIVVTSPSLLFGALGKKDNYHRLKELIPNSERNVPVVSVADATDLYLAGLAGLLGVEMKSLGLTKPGISTLDVHKNYDYQEISRFYIALNAFQMLAEKLERSQRVRSEARFARHPERSEGSRDPSARQETDGRQDDRRAPRAEVRERIKVDWTVLQKGTALLAMSLWQSKWFLPVVGSIGVGVLIVLILRQARRLLREIAQEEKWPIEALEKGGVILTNRKINPELRQFPLPRGKKIAILELEEGDSLSFAWSFVAEISRPDYRNEVIKIRLPREQALKNAESFDLRPLLNGFEPDLILAPFDGFTEGEPVRQFLQKYADTRAGLLKVLFYESFHMTYPANFFVPFTEEDHKAILEALEKHATQNRRTDYLEVQEHLPRFAAKVGKILGRLEPTVEFANPFTVAEIESGNDPKIVDDVKEFKWSRRVPMVGLSPHPDDDLLGFGGLIRKLLRLFPSDRIGFENWVVGSGHTGVAELTREQVESAMEELKWAFAPMSGDGLLWRIQKIHETYQRVLKEKKAEGASIPAGFESKLMSFADVDSLFSEIQEWRPRWKLGVGVSSQLVELIRRMIRKQEVVKAAEKLATEPGGRLVVRWLALEAAGYFRELGDAPEWLLKEGAEALKARFENFYERNRNRILADEKEGIPWTVIIPHPRDSHYHHRWTTQIALEALKEISREKGIKIRILFYLAPWSGGFDTYFLSDGEKTRENWNQFAPSQRGQLEAALEYQQALAVLVGELARPKFGLVSPSPDEMGGRFAERFVRMVLNPRAEVRITKQKALELLGVLDGADDFLPPIRPEVEKLRTDPNPGVRDMAERALGDKRSELRSSVTGILASGFAGRPDPREEMKEKVQGLVDRMFSLSRSVTDLEKFIPALREAFAKDSVQLGDSQFRFSSTRQELLTLANLLQGKYQALADEIDSILLNLKLQEAVEITPWMKERGIPVEALYEPNVRLFIGVGNVIHSQSYPSFYDNVYQNPQLLIYDDPEFRKELALLEEKGWIERRTLKIIPVPLQILTREEVRWVMRAMLKDPRIIRIALTRPVKVWAVEEGPILRWDPETGNVGAANTAAIERDETTGRAEYVGRSTDGRGTLVSMKSELARLGRSLAKARVAIIGLGGFGLAQLGHLLRDPEAPQEIIIVHRDESFEEAKGRLEKALKNFESETGRKATKVTMIRTSAVNDPTAPIKNHPLKGVDVISDTSGVGMKDRVSLSLSRLDLVEPGMIVYHGAYRDEAGKNLVAPLLEEAKKRGAIVHTGIVDYFGHPALQGVEDIKRAVGEKPGTPGWNDAKWKRLEDEIIEKVQPWADHRGLRDAENRSELRTAPLLEMTARTLKRRLSKIGNNFPIKGKVEKRKALKTLLLLLREIFNLPEKEGTGSATKPGGSAVRFGRKDDLDLKEPLVTGVEARAHGDKERLDYSPVRDLRSEMRTEALNRELGLRSIQTDEEAELAVELLLSLIAEQSGIDPDQPFQVDPFIGSTPSLSRAWAKKFFPVAQNRGYLTLSGRPSLRGSQARLTEKGVALLKTIRTNQSARTPERPVTDILLGVTALHLWKSIKKFAFVFTRITILKASQGIDPAWTQKEAFDHVMKRLSGKLPIAPAAVKVHMRKLGVLPKWQAEKKGAALIRFDFPVTVELADGQDKGKCALLTVVYTTLAYLGVLSGHREMKTVLTDPMIENLLDKVMTQDILPHFPFSMEGDPEGYYRTLLSKLKNASIDLQASWLEKAGLAPHLNQSFLWLIKETKGEVSSETAFVLAAMFRYVTAVAEPDSEGRPQGRLDNGELFPLTGENVALSGPLRGLFGKERTFLSPALKKVMLKFFDAYRLLGLSRQIRRHYFQMVGEERSLREALLLGEVFNRLDPNANSPMKASERIAALEALARLAKTVDLHRPAAGRIEEMTEMAGKDPEHFFAEAREGFGEGQTAIDVVTTLLRNLARRELNVVQSARELLLDMGDKGGGEIAVPFLIATLWHWDTEMMGSILRTGVDIVGLVRSRIISLLQDLHGQTASKVLQNAIRSAFFKLLQVESNQEVTGTALKGLENVGTSPKSIAESLGRRLKKAATKDDVHLAAALLKQFLNRTGDKSSVLQELSRAGVVNLLKENLVEKKWGNFVKGEICLLLDFIRHSAEESNLLELSGAAEEALDAAEKTLVPPDAKEAPSPPLSSSSVRSEVRNQKRRAGKTVQVFHRTHLVNLPTMVEFGIYYGSFDSDRLNPKDLWGAMSLYSPDVPAMDLADDPVYGPKSGSVGLVLRLPRKALKIILNPRSPGDKDPIKGSVGVKRPSQPVRFPREFRKLLRRWSKRRDYIDAHIAKMRGSVARRFLDYERRGVLVHFPFNVVDVEETLGRNQGKMTPKNFKRLERLLRSAQRNSRAEVRSEDPDSFIGSGDQRSETRAVSDSGKLRVAELLGLLLADDVERLWNIFARRMGIPDAAAGEAGGVPEAGAFEEIAREVARHSESSASILSMPRAKNLKTEILRRPYGPPQDDGSEILRPALRPGLRMTDNLMTDDASEIASPVPPLRRDGLAMTESSRPPVALLDDVSGETVFVVGPEMFAEYGPILVALAGQKGAKGTVPGNRGPSPLLQFFVVAPEDSAQASVAGRVANELNRALPRDSQILVLKPASIKVRLWKLGGQVQTLGLAKDEALLRSALQNVLPDLDWRQVQAETQAALSYYSETLADTLVRYAELYRALESAA